MNIFGFWRNRRSASPSSRDQRRLLQELARYQRIFQSSYGYTYFEWDPRTNSVTWDGLFWQEMGYTRRDIKSYSTPELFIKLVHPDDARNVVQFTERHVKLDAPGSAVFRIRKKHGGYIWMEVRCKSVRDDQGRVKYTSGIMFDISEQKTIEEALLMSEARHARIIKASNDGIWEWESERQSFHFSSRCWQQLGFEETDDEINQNTDRLETWRGRIHPDDLSVFDKALSDHFTKNLPFDVEYRIRSRDGTWRWIRARGSMNYDKDGKPWRMSGTNMDITDLKFAQEDVMKAKEDAVEANTAKSRFLSAMSHELRTPLNAIVGFSQLLELDTNLSSMQRDNIREIHKAGDHLLGLVNEILDLSKVESGSAQLKLESLSPASIARDCIGLMRADADARGISIDTDFSLEKSTRVIADARRIKQVLLNLISNAVKYNVPNGSIKIRGQLEQDKYVRISVTDTGKGIPRGQREAIFRPFNRLSAEGSTIEGTGIGLTIAKQLVEQMGGDMNFSTLEGKGSTFWFSMPLDIEEHRAQISSSAASVNKSQATDHGKLSLNFSGYKKILYVEDGEANQKLMKQLLARYSQISLIIAPDGFSGLYEARIQSPDLIIMDINLPGMNGFETLDVLKREPNTKDIPVIALSANAMEHNIKQGLDAGFINYLTKPLNMQQLVDVFNELLHD